MMNNLRESLTTEERMTLLTDMGVSFTSENVDEVFVNEVIQ